jgi:hypothetical protein
MTIEDKKKESNLKEPNHSADVTELNQSSITQKLNGKTLMIYLILLNQGKIGVRELQRQLELSSPSVAKYHLDKLVELHLAKNENGLYLLINKAQIPALSTWILIGHWIFPRILFAAIFFSCLFLGYLFLIYRFMNADSFFVILIGVTISCYLWFEVILQWKQRPF